MAIYKKNGNAGQRQIWKLSPLRWLAKVTQPARSAKPTMARTSLTLPLFFFFTSLLSSSKGRGVNLHPSKLGSFMVEGLRWQQWLCRFGF